MLLSLACIILAYLIGSISAACIFAYLFGRIDMRSERDGRISAAEVYVKLGKLPFILTVLGDILLSVGAVIFAKILTGSVNVMMIAGFAAVVGHNWSLFNKFKGGLGATAIAGVLIVLLAWQMLWVLSVAAVVLLFTHRSGVSTIIGVATSPAIIWFESGFSVLVVFPITLICLMLLKKYQISRETSIAR